MPPTGLDLQDARAIVEWVLGAAVDPVGTPGSLLGQDFDLSEGGRRTGAMVVARSVAPARPQSWGSVRRQNWDARGCRSWVVRLGSVGGSGPDERMIVGLLAELEGAGGTGFQRADQVRVAALRAAGVRLSPEERVLEDLEVFGVVAAESLLGNDGPPTVVAKAPEPAVSSAEAVNTAVEDEAWRPETRARLIGAPGGAGSGAGDRHLFVWLDPANHVATAAMDPDEVPAPPLLSPETTILWVARRPSGNDGVLADRVWQTNPAGEWESLGSVTDRRVMARASQADTAGNQANRMMLTMPAARL